MFPLALISSGQPSSAGTLQDAYGDRPTMLADVCARAGFVPRKIVRIAEWTGKFGYVAAGLGVALVPSPAAWAVPEGLVLARLTDPALRRTLHIALPATPLPAALTLRELLQDGSLGGRWPTSSRSPTPPHGDRSG